MNDRNHGLCHDVSILPDTSLYKLLGKNHIHVNSIHHQAVKDLSEQLKPMAVSEDGIIEAVYMPAHSFVWGIQWHPEYWYETNEDCLKIFRQFLESVSNSRNQTA